MIAGLNVLGLGKNNQSIHVVGCSSIWIHCILWLKFD